MGQEVPAQVRLGERVSSGRAALETAELIFRGDFRLRIPLREIQHLAVVDGRLEISWQGGRALFDLGPYAQKWADKIENPRGLLDKLGVKAGAGVAVLGVADEDFLAQLRTRVAEPDLTAYSQDYDLVFWAADEVADLAGLAELRGRIRPNGAIWVVSPKGKAARIRDIDVIAEAKAAGLVDTKVVSFSSTHTALKLVVPVAMRGAAKEA